ncbi:YgfZ/GcvT domain-containing protein [Deinococcus peraridilitoris]|uniref:Folate-binding protein YgfZ n=1 Tax=Deinococcus peraridilitoris (strain DSM 19664 / LMG 22246 / CIP 109416 / KR-200) TaxID=937777 RepID=L0A4A8_DEIPD|nr:folate-binding protein YgfZ [Deinococcus peraridilitoris]AFZ67865.1 folate-binding protein YgfZ [Deinococcus peraridilitoris DSM 19664]
MNFTRLPSSALQLTGTDRLDFVQGQMTGDLKRAPVPGMVPALFLNVRGQIEFFARVYRRPDDVYLHLAEGEAVALQARLRRYIIFDQVEIEDLGETLTTLHVWSQDFPNWDSAGADVQQFELAGGSVLGARVNRTGQLGVDLHVLTRQLGAVLAALGGVERSFEHLERARVLAGLADTTRDRWQGSLLQEVGLDDAISYRKGCYVGQEIMARLEARGNTRSRLAALEGEDLPSYSEVVFNGKVVGQSGHSVGERVLVKLRKEVELGSEVQVGGVTARVTEARAPVVASFEPGR